MRGETREWIDEWEKRKGEVKVRKERGRMEEGGRDVLREVLCKADKL